VLKAIFSKEFSTFQKLQGACTIGRELVTIYRSLEMRKGNKRVSRGWVAEIVCAQNSWKW